MTDDLTASESAILLVLMVEARPVLNTELKKRWGIDVAKPQRDKLNALHLVRSEPSRPTYVHELDDKGWVRVQSGVDVSTPRARIVGGAFNAYHAAVTERIVAKAGFSSLGELFSLSDVKPSDVTESRRHSDLQPRLRHAYAALASEPGAWVALVRLRPFFLDIDRSTVDAALLQMSRAHDVNFVPEDNQKALSAAARAAAVHIGDQDKHLLAIEKR